METLLQDIRYGWRMLVKNPGFALVAVFTLALGIGANLAIFSYVDELWLRPMPVPHADRLVRIFTSNPTSQGDIERGVSSYPDYQDLRASVTSLSGLAVLERRGAMFDDGTQNKLATVAVLSDNFFDVLQAQMALGRTFTEAEMKSASGAGALPILISYPFWESQFHGDASVVNRDIIVDRQHVLVLGVLPRSFRGTVPQMVPELWIPMSTWLQLAPGNRQMLASRGTRDFELFGRLKDDVTLGQAKAEIAAIVAQLSREYPETNAGRTMTALTDAEARGAQVQQTGILLLGVAALVLLIASANLASLLLARAEYRRREMATRIALGAARMRLARQLLTETVLLALAGTAAALLLGNALLTAMPAVLPHTSIPAGVDAYLSIRGLIFAVGATLAAMSVFGVVPALQASRVAPSSALKQHGGERGSARPLARSALVIGQIALSLALVETAGLLVHSVLKSLAMNPGFDAHQNMLVTDVWVGAGNKAAQDSFNFVREARRRIEELPGVTDTTVALRIPFGMSYSGYTKKVFPQTPVPGAEREGIPINTDKVADHYFDTLGTRILRGRPITAQDLQSNARVMVVNQQMAARFWPNEDPIGQVVRLEKRQGDSYEVIGIAEDGKYNDLQEDPMPYLYLPMTMDDYGEVTIAVKTAGDAGALASAVRQILRDLNRDVAVLGMITLRQHMRQALYDQRYTSTLIVLLGGLGLLLAALGLYGLMAFLVGRRRQEIAIRLALGAERSRIFRLIVGQALILTIVGLAIGVAVSIAATHALRGFLFGVSAGDALAMAVAISVLITVALIAALAPAIRATRVDPMVSLRYE